MVDLLYLTLAALIELRVCTGGYTMVLNLTPQNPIYTAALNTKEVAEDPLTDLLHMWIECLTIMVSSPTRSTVSFFRVQPNAHLLLQCSVTSTFVVSSPVLLCPVLSAVQPVQE